MMKKWGSSTLALLLGLVLLAPLTPVSAAPGYSPDDQESAFLGLINDYRASVGAGPLSMNDSLGAAADFHSYDMATNNYFAHTLADGTSAGDNIKDHGYTGSTWGENIAAGMESANDALVDWQNSPEHDVAMRDPDYTEIGVGRYYDANSQYGWYWTTDFGGGEQGTPPTRRNQDASATNSPGTLNGIPVDQSSDAPATLNGVPIDTDGQTTTTVNGRSTDGNGRTGGGNRTVTVNGVPVSNNGVIVDADGRVITTIDGQSGNAPITTDTTIYEEPAVTNTDYVPPAPVYDEPVYTEDTTTSDPGGYVDENGNWVDTTGAAETASDPGGYVDENGNWVDTTGAAAVAETEPAADPGGYVDENGNWVDSTGAVAETEPVSDPGGYVDENGNWVDTTGAETAAADTTADPGGYVNENGDWVDTSGAADAAGYVDENGNWVDTSGADTGDSGANGYADPAASGIQGFQQTTDQGVYDLAQDGGGGLSADGATTYDSSGEGGATGDGATIVYGDIETGGVEGGTQVIDGSTIGDIAALPPADTATLNGEPVEAVGGPTGEIAPADAPAPAPAPNPEGTITTTTTINGITMDEGSTSTDGDASTNQGRGNGSAKPGHVSFGN